MPRRIGVGYLELVVDLGAEHSHAAWGIDTQLHAFTVNGEHRNGDVLAKQQTLLALAAQHEHYSASVLTCAIVCVVV
jgi:hypothetical protein